MLTSTALLFFLPDEKSQDHARLVHKLLSQYVEGNTDWVEKYPTSRHVPTVCVCAKGFCIYLVCGTLVEFCVKVVSVCFGENTILHGYSETLH